LDASEIVPGLYQGAAPPVGNVLKDAGFDTAVLCAEEWQPPKSVESYCRLAMNYSGTGHPYPGITIVYAPNEDDFIKLPSRKTLAMVLSAANYVVKRVLAGGKVHVSCWAGKNRSGLVTTMALHRLTGLDGVKCVELLKKARPEALSNPLFVSILQRIPATLPTQKV
jgi:hypothetical protein